MFSVNVLPSICIRLEKKKRGSAEMVRSLALTIDPNVPGSFVYMYINTYNHIDISMYIYIYCISNILIYIYT